MVGFRRTGNSVRLSRQWMCEGLGLSDVDHRQVRYLFLLFGAVFTVTVINKSDFRCLHPDFIQAKVLNKTLDNSARACVEQSGKRRRPRRHELRRVGICSSSSGAFADGQQEATQMF